PGSPARAASRRPGSSAGRRGGGRPGPLAAHGAASGCRTTREGAGPACARGVPESGAMSFQDFADASPEDEKIFPDVAFTFERWMMESMFMKEASTKTYVKSLKLLFMEDGKTYAAMASPEYFEAVKKSPANKRANSNRTSGLKKFTEFWEHVGKKNWAEKSGWLSAPGGKRAYFLEAPVGLGRPDGDGTFAGARRPATSAAPAGAAPPAPAPPAPAQAAATDAPAAQPAAAGEARPAAAEAAGPARRERSRSRDDDRAPAAKAELK
ncbi:unnamed protein product, partial [Prorocentrum cordatum]